jgi:hypothetical protein
MYVHSDILCKSFGSDITSTKDESKTIPAPQKKKRLLEKLENFERCSKGDSMTKGPGPTICLKPVLNTLVDEPQHN